MKKKNVLKQGTIYTGKNKLINNIFFFFFKRDVVQKECMGNRVNEDKNYILAEMK